ncbi:S-layer homology domain-containing protein [Pelosinus fermentans]|uniref:S-layer domain-containing protein n=1 Tax=Pelosinus fermentans JBW45 TaxID=1192197 RepID=I9DAZ3_9FIRM|nr:S-layer homology domain-containing protein [Pelosinus fermentans]AJQ28971.1 S-layer domain-containing protein [Pelosinus fermentans JBW45]
MKKDLVIFLLIPTMVLSIAGTSLAATVDHLSDVKPDSWAYKAVNDLVKAGIIDINTSDGIFNGTKAITRNKMASLVLKAMARFDKANDAQKDEIEKLAKEFKDEFQSFDRRVERIEHEEEFKEEFKDQFQSFDRRLEKLEDKTANPRLSMYGYSRIRYDRDNFGTRPYQDNWTMWVNINTNFKINDTWSLRSENEFENDITNNTGAYTSNDYQRPFLQLYADGSIGETKVKLGRYYHLSPYGLTFDDKIDGFQISYGDKIKATLNSGNTYSHIMYGYSGNPDGVWEDGSTNYRVTSVEVEAPVNPTTNIKGSYGKVTRRQTGEGFKSYEIGFNTKLSEDLSFFAAYAKSDFSYKNKANIMSLQYKSCDPGIPGSYDIYVKKYFIQGHSSLTNIFLDDLKSNNEDWSARYNEFKGIRIGFEYVPVRSTKLICYYTVGKANKFDPGNIYNNVQEDAKFSRVQWEFYF